MLLIDYLLGDLKAAEVAAVRVRLASDDAFHEKMCLAFGWVAAASGGEMHPNIIGRFEGAPTPPGLPNFNATVFAQEILDLLDEAVDGGVRERKEVERQPFTGRACADAGTDRADRTRPSG